MTTQPSQPCQLNLTDREKEVKFRLSQWGKHSIIEVVKESSELSKTDAINLILAGQRHSNYTTVSYPLPPNNGGFIMSNPLKQCGTCKQYLDRTLFGKDKYNFDGLNYTCKLCRKQKAAISDKKYYKSHRAEILKNKKVYFEKNQMQLVEKAKNRYHSAIEEHRSRARKYHHSNKELLNPKHRQYYWKNRDRFLIQKRKYRLEHLEQASVGTSRYKAKKRGNGGSHTVLEWRYLKEVNGNRCLKCGRCEPEIKLTKDHIVPISRGGTDNIGNLQPLCLGCNISKHTKTEDYRGRRFKRGNKLRNNLP